MPWLVVALVGASTVLSFAIIAEYFRPELAGRANGALNVLHFSWGFLAQYGTGLVLTQWPGLDGHYSVMAYRIAFGAKIALQLITLGWFILPSGRTLVEWLEPPLSAGTLAAFEPGALVASCDLPILMDDPGVENDW